MRSPVAAIAFAFIGFIVGAVFFTAVSLVLAWTGPTSAPPNGNVSAPINVGTVDQIKNAGLGINSLAVFGNAILAGASSYLNFGNTSGSGGYGIRDNAGTMEFKNSAGGWASLQSIVATLVGTDAGIPSGAVMAFNLSACPTGWSGLAGAAGRFIVGVGSNGTNSYALGVSGGADARTLTVAQLPPHSHTVTDTYPGGSPPVIQTAAGFSGLAINGGSAVRTTSSVGSGSAIDMRPAYLALLYCQKN